MTIAAGQLAAVLAERFAERGLVRTGTAARLLHVRHTTLVEHMRSGVVPSESISHLGVTYHGVPQPEVARLHQLMWPACKCETAGLVKQ